MILFLLLFLSFLTAFPVAAETSSETKFGLGGLLTTGNSQVESLSTDFFFNRNRKWVDEFTCQANIDHQATNATQTLYKIYSSLRYAYSRGKQFYNFFKLEAEQDRFQNISLRLIPSAGVGYWLADQKTYKNMVEGAVGYQRKYMVNKTEAESIVLKLRSYWLRGNFINNLNVYLAANDLGNYRFINQALYNVKINNHYALKLQLKDEYNNRPATGIQNNDLIFTVGLEFSFKKSS